jgi:hypothetical protein
MKVPRLSEHPIGNDFAPSLEQEQYHNRMTFQVALVGTDGLIVGSDRRSIYYSPMGPEDVHSSIQPGENRKFVEAPDKSVVCAFAGSPFAVSLAKAIVYSARYTGAVNDFERGEALNAIAHSLDPLEGMLKDEVLIIRRENLGSVTVMARKGHGSVTTADTTTWICTGNNSVPARFIPWHFWKRRPVYELGLLALLTLSYAAHEEKSMIGAGFDFIILTAEGFSEKHLDEDDPRIEEIRELFELKGEEAIIAKRGIMDAGCPRSRF